MRKHGQRGRISRATEVSGTRPQDRMRRGSGRGSGAPPRPKRRTGKADRGSEEARPDRAPVPEPAERDSDEASDVPWRSDQGSQRKAHALAGGRRSGGAKPGGEMLRRRHGSAELPK